MKGIFLIWMIPIISQVKFRCYLSVSDLFLIFHSCAFCVPSVADFKMQVADGVWQRGNTHYCGVGKLDEKGALQNSLFIFSCLHIIIFTDFGFLGVSK